MLLGIRRVLLDFNYRTFTFYGAGFSCFIKKLVLKLILILKIKEEKVTLVTFSVVFPRP
jgi:hypothetical protein